MKYSAVLAFVFTLMLVVPVGMARAHAFPEHQVPGAGAELDSPPKAVTIRFDRAVEPLFSTLRVENEASKRVDAKDSHMSHGRTDTLAVTLKPMINGRYHVFWIAVGRDGHRTHGDYWFSVHKAVP